ncbi:MAG: flagellar hook-basal body complex protein [Oscillospiraceae bacterium]|nr:flagellar hook-basal body complex protein [Oscillospiraceae bacterium]
MLRSMFAGVAGLRNHQVKMDVVANNISNVNTFGYKASRTAFTEMYNQTLASAVAPSESGAVGGSNARQIGLGVQTAAIDVIHTQGATQTTDRGLDLVIDGEGFFVVRQDENIFYTRAGNLYLDAFGYLVTADGMYIQGRMFLTADDITSAESEGGTPLVEQKVIERIEQDGELIVWGNGKEEPGQLQELLGEGEWPRRGENPEMMSEIFGEGDGERQVGRMVIPTFYKNIAIGQDGVILGEDENGSIVQIGVIMTATFVNPAGLERVGSSLYRQTANSGSCSITVPGDDVNGFLTAGALEMSNVDLSKEFTEMIITQRGFQANSRIITVSDTLLEELVNLKR